MVVADNRAKAEMNEDQLQKLNFELGLIERKEQASKLRTAKVTEVEEDKIAALMEQIEQRLRDEDILMAKEDEARKLRMAELQGMKTKLHQLATAERVRKSKESMAQEIFEEDAERIKFELGGKIEKLTSESRKRRIASDDESASRSKKRSTDTLATAVDRQADLACDDSQTVPSSSMIPETVFGSQSTVTDSSSDDEPKHLWSCGFCGRHHPHLIDHKGKDIVCGCSPRLRVLSDIDGGVGDQAEECLHSDDETVA